MAILDLGYRAWEGVKTRRGTRWMDVARSSISLVWRAFWLRRLVIFATLPSILVLVLFFLYEQGHDRPEMQRAVVGFVQWSSRPTFGREIVSGESMNQYFQKFQNAMLQDPKKSRLLVWTQLIYWFNRSPQALMCIIIVGMVGPRLICYDLRSRAYLLYLSRPISTWEYILGKISVLAFLLALVTAIPSLLVYFAGLMLSPSYGVFWDTWDLPLRIILSLFFVAIPMSSLCIAFSAFTSETRFANAAWFSTWIIGQISYLILTGGEVLRVRNEAELEVAIKKWQIVSPYQLLDTGQRWIFGIKELNLEVVESLVIVLGVATVSLVLTYRRFSKLLRG